MRKYIQILLLCLTLTPLVFSEIFLYPFVDGKMFFVRIIACIISILFAWLVISDIKERENIVQSFQKMFRDPIFIMFSVGIVLLGVSTVFAFNPRVAFLGEMQRGEGFMTLSSLYCIYVAMRLFFEKKQWNTFFVISGIVSLCMFFSELFQSLSGTDRPSATMGNPVFLANYFVFSIFVGYFLIRLTRILRKDWYAFLGYSVLFSSIVGILITKTRGVLLGILVGFIVCLLHMLFSKYSNGISGLQKKISAGVLILIVVFGIFVFFTRHNSRWSTIPVMNRITNISSTDSTTVARLMFTKTAIQSFASDHQPVRMLFGWGWDNYIFFTGTHYNPKVFFYDTAVVDRGHNKLMDMLIMTGILGLLAYLILWFFIIQKTLVLIDHDYKPGIITLFFFLAYFVSNLSAFDTITTFLTLYVVCAFVESITYEERK